MAQLKHRPASVSPASTTGAAEQQRSDVETSVDERALQIGRRLASTNGGLRQVGRRVSDLGMSSVSGDPQLKAAMFRLVDVAPACSGPQELARHLDSYLAQVKAPARPASAARRLAGSATAAKSVGRLTSLGVTQMAGRFIVAEDPASAGPKLGRLWRRGVATSVDLLGEATVSQEEAESYFARCMQALEDLSAPAAKWPEIGILSLDSLGVIPKVNLSVKLTALTPLIRPQAPERGAEDAAQRLRPLLRKARDLGAHLHIDMESYDSRDMVLELVLDLLDEPEFREGPAAGLVLQAYLRDAPKRLEQIIEWIGASDRRAPLTIRLVKGAYWDHETIEAAQHGWQAPVWTNKADTDRCFEQLTRRLLDERLRGTSIRPAIASHNLRSVSHAVAYAEQIGLARSEFEFQVLRGLGEDLQDALARDGFRCRTYCPVGNMVAGMAYLVRRLLENTSNDSFLASRMAGENIDQLLRRP